MEWFALALAAAGLAALVASAFIGRLMLRELNAPAVALGRAVVWSDQVQWDRRLNTGELQQALLAGAVS